MSVETAIERVADKIAESYQVVREKGGALPVQKNIHNLPDAIRTIDGDFAFGSYEYWCPKMTGPNTPAPYAVGAHIWNTTDTPWKAFDGSDKTYWGNVYSNRIQVAHLKFDFGESTKIAGVQLSEYDGNPGGLPKVIAIYGSNDDENWNEIVVDDHSTDIQCISPRDISFDVVKYRFYRFDCKGRTWITDDITDSYTIAIGDIQLATFQRDLSYCPVITLQEKTAAPRTEIQDISADEGYTGLSNVIIEPATLQSKTVRSSLKPQTVVADDEHYGLDEVTVDPYILQKKTVVPTITSQKVTADESYDALSEVTVEKIPEVYKDTSDATASADDILEGKTAYINGEKVTGTALGTSPEPNFQEKTVTPTATPQVVQPDSGYDGLSQVSISGDENLATDNIKAGVSIFGVDGSYDPMVVLESLTVTPTTSPQTKYPSNGVNGFSDVTVKAIPSTYKDTSDATASAIDILSGKTAYVNGSKVTGTYTTPSLQAKTVTPTKSSQSVTPDASYGGLSKVTVNAIPPSYIITTDATASASDILSGKTAYINGEKVTGTAAGTSAEVKLQQKTATPTADSQEITPDDNYDALSKVTVTSIPSIYKDTSDATALASDIKSGKTAYINGEKVTGTASLGTALTLQTKTATPKTTVQDIVPDADYDALSKVTVEKIPDIYKDTSDATASASDIKSGKTAYVNGSKVTGSISSVEVPTPSISVNSTGLITASNTMGAGYTVGGTKSSTSQLSCKTSETFTPTTSNQTIASGQYLTGTQTIKGDSNLKAANIKSGVSIFGVSGSYSGFSVSLQSKTVTPSTSSQSVTPDSGYDGLSSVTVKAVSLTTKTVTPSSSSQTVTPTSSYVGFSSVTVNAIPSSYTNTSDGTAVASDIKSGMTAYVNGSKVTGTLASRTLPNPSVTISTDGLITASYTMSAGYVAAASASGTKQMTTKSVATIMPGTTDTTIASATYLTGTQTIKGDSNLKAANIKSGVSIFGVSGSYSGEQVGQVTVNLTFESGLEGEKLTFIIPEYDSSYSTYTLNAYTASASGIITSPVSTLILHNYTDQPVYMKMKPSTSTKFIAKAWGFNGKVGGYITSSSTTSGLNMLADTSARMANIAFRYTGTNPLTLTVTIYTT